ncbi:hypothetical protein SNE40_004100 [Patella caerulea]|uniref:Uncharacterized protein n=1 Tax=Patella caerulea TaxID=87958 RepID=A0AAN8QG96_PATCE
MKVSRVLIVFLGIVMTVEGFLDNIACVAGTAACAVQLATATTGQTCSDKRPYFQCLANNGCQASTDFYKSQVTAFNYTGCGT